ncbi:MAG: GNAT family N-acetyltransferase [Clostridiales bacterium]|jgi:GNAT superfamily N-acetyltransferase|nr:GNAT family N-acetyltransferase [Clostridiales bacterium]
MFDLSRDKYEMLLEPIMKIPFNILMARSVIIGHSDGRIFVDSCEYPQSYYIVHSYGMTYLCGYSGNEEFNAGLFGYFKGKAYTRNKDEWLQAFPRDWDFVMNSLVDEGVAAPYSRLNFKFDKDKFYEKYNQADKFQYDVISTPTDMLFDISGSVVPKDYWKTAEQFTNLAKAFTVMVDGKPVSTAFTSARHDDKLEIGIETLPSYQGKGLAYLACAKLIEYCMDRTLEPVWSCRLENFGSVNLAKKLGFIETLRMPYYHIPK